MNKEERESVEQHLKDVQEKLNEDDLSEDAKEYYTGLEGRLQKIVGYDTPSPGGCIGALLFLIGAGTVILCGLYNLIA